MQNRRVPVLQQLISVYKIDISYDIDCNLFLKVGFDDGPHVQKIEID